MDATTEQSRRQCSFEIPLTGEAKDRSLEMSGLAWYKDNLILMPQYVNKDDPCFYYLNKKSIIKWIESSK